MHNEIETLEVETPDLRVNDRHRVSVLSGIYLDAGLPLELATRSAIADYELFEVETVCA